MSNNLRICIFLFMMYLFNGWYLDIMDLFNSDNYKNEYELQKMRLSYCMIMVISIFMLIMYVYKLYILKKSLPDSSVMFNIYIFLSLTIIFNIGIIIYMFNILQKSTPNNPIILSFKQFLIELSITIFFALILINSFIELEIYNNINDNDNDKDYLNSKLTNYEKEYKELNNFYEKLFVQDTQEKTVTEGLKLNFTFGKTDKPTDPNQTQIPTQNQNQAQTLNQNQAQTLNQNQILTQNQIPNQTQIPTQTLNQIPNQTQIPTQTLNQIPTQTQIPTQNQIPTQTLNQIPTQNQAQTLTQIPTQTLNQIPTQNQAQTLNQNQAQTLTQIPTQNQPKFQL